MADNATEGIVADVDHVTTVLAGREARQLFSSLSRLGLFVAWPYLDYGTFRTGGVRLGNLNFEVIGTDGEAGGGPAPAGPQAGTGAGPAQGDGEGASAWPQQFVTLAPASLTGLPAALDERGIRHGDPEPFAPEAGAEPAYTTVALPDLGSARLTVQFRAYPEGPRTGAVAPGDLAGVQQVDRVVLGASDVDRARQQWAALLAPGQPEPPGGWQPGYGPALEVRPAGEDAVVELVLRVRSLATARAAFTAAGLAVAGDMVEIGTVPARLVAG
jgi:hypothetical protein